MEGRGGEAGFVDVGEGTAGPAVADLEQVCVGGVVAEGGEEDEGVEAGAVVVDLSLDALEFAAVAGEVRWEGQGVERRGGRGDAYMLSQYRRALPFQPQCGTVGV